MSFKINSLIVKSFMICLAYGIVIQDGPSAKRQTSFQSHQTKKIVPHDRQSPQRCDLICPGILPLRLPPNFIQNCDSVAQKNVTQNTQSNNKTTTLKPTTTTTSGDDSNETDESLEESSETSTKEAAGRSKNKGNIQKHRKTKGINQSSQVRKKFNTAKQYQNKKSIRKEKVLLKHEVKKILAKRNRQFKGRSKIDGCYVVCSDSEGSESSYPGNGGNQVEPEDSASQEEPYIPGEDTAIEIFYIPENIHDNQGPVDLYQTNNYAFLEPQPAFEYGFDPFFMEGKQKKIKKRKQELGRNEANSNGSNKKANNRHKHRQAKNTLYAKEY